VPQGPLQELLRFLRDRERAALNLVENGAALKDGARLVERAKARAARYGDWANALSQVVNGDNTTTKG
jgi:hypothetical protein